MWDRGEGRPLKVVGQDLGHRCVKRNGERPCAAVHQHKGQSANANFSSYGPKSNSTDAPPLDHDWRCIRIVRREGDTEGVEEDVPDLGYAPSAARGEHRDASGIDSPLWNVRHLRLLPATLGSSDQGKFDAEDEHENGKANQATDDGRGVTGYRQKTAHGDHEAGQIEGGEGSGQTLRPRDISGRKPQAERLLHHGVHDNGDGQCRRGLIPRSRCLANLVLNRARSEEFSSDPSE